MSEKKPPQSDGKRLKTVISLLNMSAYKLANLAGVTPAALYHITADKNKLSDALIEKIVRRFDQVSYAYLKTGEGEPILQTPSEKRAQHNMFLLPGERLDSVDKINTDVNEENDSDLFRQVQELIYQQKKSNETLKHLVQVIEILQEKLN